MKISEYPPGTYISVDLAHHEIFRAGVGKGSIRIFKRSKFLQKRCIYPSELVFMSGFRRTKILLADPCLINRIPVRRREAAGLSKLTLLRPQ